jgi:hypothetical protein
MPALKPRPDFETLEGTLPSDHWATPRLALQLAAAPADRVIRAVVTNPHHATAYLRNRVRIAVDGRTVFDDMLFAGHGVEVEHHAPAKAPVLFELESEASLAPDPIDGRNRGVWLNLIQRAAETR